MRASTKAEMVEHLHEELSMNKREAKELVGLLLEETRYAFKDDE